jgi:hypothetical protein
MPGENFKHRFIKRLKYIIMKQNLKFFTRMIGYCLMMAVAACNNTGKSTSTKGDSITSTDTSKNNPSKQANLMNNFREYKLEKTTMQTWQNNKNATKILLKIKLDDLADPNSMTLWAYPAKNHKDYAENIVPTEIKPFGNSISFDDKNDLTIGNNELALKYFHQDDILAHPWRNFGYIILKPAKTAAGNLCFTITSYSLDGNKIVFAIPAETNPSPPATPEER